MMHRRIATHENSSSKAQVNPTYFPSEMTRLFLAWKKVPGINKKNASLLGRSGIHPNILKLHLYLLIMIGDFLYTQEPYHPLEWLIMSALFQSYIPIANKQNTIATSEQEDREISMTLFTTLYTHYSAYRPNPAIKKMTTDEGRLLNLVTRKSQEVTSAAFCNAAKYLTPENKSQVAMIMPYGSEGQKALTLYYLLNELFILSGSCSVCYKECNQASMTEYEDSYKSASLYVTFIENRFTFWFNDLRKKTFLLTPSAEENNLIEVKIVEQFTNTLGNAKLALKKCPPPHPFKTQCTIS